MIECLVLPSAGYRLISLVGSIKYLQEVKYYERKNIKDIYGVSAGSWLGTIICLTENWDDLVDYVINRPYNKIYQFKVDDYINMIENKGIINIDMIRNFVKPIFDSNDIDIDTITLKEFYDITNINMNIYAVNTTNYISVNFNHKSEPDMRLLEALYMSATVPLVFTPLFYKNTCYVDGGLHIDYPLEDALKKYKDDNILSLYVTDSNFEKNNIINTDDNVLVYFIKLFNGVRRARTKEKYIRNKKCIVIETEASNYKNIMKFLNDKTERQRLFDIGYEVSKTYIDNLKQV